jgi:hypothetical protein
MGDVGTSLRLLAILAAANMAPILAKRLLCERWAMPLDAGSHFLDGRPLLGRSKTLRGVIVATACAALVAAVLGIPASLGARIGAAAMLGDAVSSFAKRRLGIEPSGRAFGLDQVPEALLGLLSVRSDLGLTPVQIAAITALFFVLEIPGARLLFRLGLRDRPY